MKRVTGVLVAVAIVLGGAAGGLERAEASSQSPSFACRVAVWAVEETAERFGTVRGADPGQVGYLSEAGKTYFFVFDWNRSGAINVSDVVLAINNDALICGGWVAPEGWA